MMNKKGDLSINLIIIAAIALLVLVVLAAIFTGRLGIFSKESNKCEPNIGKCVSITSGCGGTEAPEYPTSHPAKCYGSDGKVDATKVCCVKVAIEKPE